MFPTMKSLAAIALCAGLANFTLPVCAVSLGDSRVSVQSELGKPDGSTTIGNREILCYPRGQVRLQDGRVVSSTLISETAFATQQAREEEDAKRRAQLAAAREAQLETEGRVILADRETNPDFLALPAHEQLRLWQIFAARYPMIPVGEEIARMRGRVETEEANLLLASARERELALLEARIEAVERRATRRGHDGGRSYRGSYYGYPLFAAPSLRKSRFVGGSGRDCAGAVHRAEPPPPAHPADAARAAVMGSFDRARNEIYSRSSP